MPWRLFGRGDKGKAPDRAAEPIEREGAEVPLGAGRDIPTTIRAKVILVPVDGCPASLEAVAVGCGLARRQKGKVYVIHVIEVPRALALDAELEPEATRGEQLLQEAEHVARQADYQVEGELLQARDVGQAVVDEAISRGVELIIMGMEHKQPTGEFQMGRLPQYVLRNAPCEVWVIRRPRSGESVA